MAGRKPLSRNFTSNSPAAPSIISPEYILEPCDYNVECETPIGIGGCSSVYVGSYRGSQVAVKCYTIGNAEPGKALLLQEAEILLKLQHLNVVKCLGICPQKSSLLLELAEIKITHNGRCLCVNSLRQLIDTVGDVMEQDLKHEALFQVLEGLDYLHNNTIVHGDLKSANVLVSDSENNYVFKLTDFGGSHAQISTKIFSNFSSMNTGKRVKPGTTSFEAPEVFQGKEKSRASDVYSFGMIMHELLYHNYSHPWESVFKQCSPNTLASLIIEAVKRGQRPKIEVHDDSPYIHVMQMCWAQEAAERPSLISLKVQIENLEIEAEKNRDFSSKTLSVSKNKSPHLGKVGNNSPLKESILARKRLSSSPLAKKKLDFNDDHSSASLSKTRMTTNESTVSSLASQKFILSNSEEDTLNGEQLRKRADKRRLTKKQTPSRDASSSSESQCDEDEAFSLSFSPTDQASADTVSELNSPPPSILQKEADDEFHLQKETNYEYHPQKEGDDEFLLQKESDIPQDEVMKWQGYANKYLNVTLKEFQLEAMRAYSCKKDSIVIQATGAGKSTCFQIPALMLTNRDVGLVIVPTVALGMDHHEAFKGLNLESVFISSTSTKSDYDKAFKLSSRVAKVIIVSPEHLFGSDTNSGILDRLLQNPGRLKFIAIDEAHLIFDWSSFRRAFGEVKKLKQLFPDCPKIALSATLKPKHLSVMRNEVLKDPVTIAGIIDRPNVSINVLAYRKDSVAEVKKQNSNVWDSTAKQIEKLIDGEKTIVYCSYALECQELSSALNLRSTRAYVYTGKNTNAEKKEVYHKMKNNEIDIVVATKAFGLGINIPSIRHVVHVGLPESLSLWMQEFGRAGRDGKQAYAHLLFCEREDLKKVKYWTNNCVDQEEKNARFNDFIDALIYTSRLYTGDCLREYQHRYFEEKKIAASVINPDVCCTGCQIRVSIPFEPSDKLLLMVQTLFFLKNHNITRVYESQILAWMSGTEENWMWFYLDSRIKEEGTYGCLKDIPESVLKLTIKATLRQCLSLNYVGLQFNVVPGTKNLAKFWSLSAEGTKVANGEVNVPMLPDPVSVATRLSPNDENFVETPKKKRKRKCEHVTSRIVTMMNDGPNSWIQLERKEQYEMLGFYHDARKLLYVKDYTLLKGCPIKPNKDYLWEDINLSKKQSFPVFKFTFKDNQSESSSSAESPDCPVLMFRAPCNGVKVCEGETEGKCQFSVNKRVHINRCVDHPDAKLMDSGPCGGYFIYLRPESDKDNRRWLAFLSAEGCNAVHSHPCPVRSKLGSKLEQAIEEAVKIDPSKTTKEISKGAGMPCNPASLSAVASNLGTLANCVKKAKNGLYSGATDRYIIENFNLLIKNSIDEKDAKNAENEETAKEILKACSPYCRFSQFCESFNFCIFATPQMLEVLNESRVVEADVTFPGAKSFPYVLNMVSFNYETLNYQVVARVLMTSLTVCAYKTAFGKVLELTTNIHPEFENGKDVRGWILDFSLAQRQGLESNLGEKADFIRGCDVHYKRGVKKIADKVAMDAPSNCLFKKIAHAIPELHTRDNVKMSFDILCGKLDLSKARTFLLQEIKCWANDIDNANNQGWEKACAWADWWGQPKVTQMFTKSFTEMTDADWAVCPRTTNAVESQNKKGCSKTKSFRDVVSNFYLEDKSICFSTFAAREGIKTGTPIAKRKVQNEKRRLNRDRPKIIEDDQSPGTTPSTTGAKQSKKRKLTPIAPTQDADQAIDDENLGKSVIIDTFGARGKKFGWCKATIIKKKDEGYIAKYVSDKKTTFIPNIHDEKFVRFCSSEEIEA